MSYFLQPTACGGRVIEAKGEDYLSRYDVPAREQTDVRWALGCMELEDVVEQAEMLLSPVLVRRMQAKLWQALYFNYDYAQLFLPQLERNLDWLNGRNHKIDGISEKQNKQIKIIDRYI